MSSNEGSCPFIRGYNNENILTIFFKNFFSRTAEPILTRQKHSWVIWIQVCSYVRNFDRRLYFPILSDCIIAKISVACGNSYEVSGPYPRVDNSEINIFTQMILILTTFKIVN